MAAIHRAARPASLTRSAKAQALFTNIVQTVRTAGTSRLLHELDADELRQLDEAVMRFRERVAWARDIAIADERAAQGRGRQ